jgi:hypothetical protein
LWTDLPPDVKKHSEMSLYSGYEVDDVYGIYGVDPTKGALAIVRPDGYIGVIATLSGANRAQSYLETLVRTI